MCKYSVIATRYFLIAAIFFIVNFARLIACCIYQSVYNNNFKNDTPDRNYMIRYFVIALFKKANIILQNSTIDTIADRLYKNEFNSAFENAKGYFLYNMIHSVVWFLIIVKKFVIFSPTTKAANKLFSLCVAFIEAIAVYLLGLFLDTTGIGNRILTYLLDLANALFGHFSA